MLLSIMPRKARGCPGEQVIEIRLVLQKRENDFLVFTGINTYVVDLLIFLSTYLNRNTKGI